jgi:hypothetical protein
MVYSFALFTHLEKPNDEGGYSVMNIRLVPHLLVCDTVLEVFIGATLGILLLA